jgi:hypothetical protein
LFRHVDISIEDGSLGILGGSAGIFMLHSLARHCTLGKEWEREVGKCSCGAEDPKTKANKTMAKSKRSTKESDEESDDARFHLVWFFSFWIFLCLIEDN